jgi:hypothetical protein
MSCCSSACPEPAPARTNAVWTRRRGCERSRISWRHHCGSADDYLKVALLVVPVPHIVTIKADRHRPVRGWQLAPVSGAADYEGNLFLAEFLFGAAISRTWWCRWQPVRGGTMALSVTSAGGWWFGNPSLSGEFRPFCPRWVCVSVVESGMSRP